MKTSPGSAYTLLLCLCFTCLLGHEYRGIAGTRPAVHKKTVTERATKKDRVVPVLQAWHSRAIRCMAFSPDSRFIVTGANDNTVRVWNTGGKLVRKIDGFAGNVVEIVFSPDSGLFLTLTGSSDFNRVINNELKLWRSDGTPVANCAGHTKGIERAFFSANGGAFLSYSRGENTVRLWDRDGKPVRMFPLKGTTVRSAALNPDGTLVAAAPVKGTTAYLWNRSGRLIALLKNSAPVLRVAASPAGKYFATAAADGTIRLWDYRGRPVRVFTGFAYDDNYRELDPFFSHDGAFIVTRGADEAELKLFSVDGKAVRSLVLSESAKALLPKEPPVRRSVWDEIEQDERKHAGPKPPPKKIKNLISYCLGTDGSIVAAVRGGAVIVWDRDGREKAALSGKIRGYIVAPGGAGRKIAVMGQDTAIEERVFGLAVWDPATKKETVVPEGFNDRYSDAYFSPDGRYLASFNDTKVSLRDGSGRLLHVFGEEVTGKVELHMDREWKYFLSYEAVEKYGHNFKVRRWSLGGRLLDTLGFGSYHQCDPAPGLDRLLSSGRRYAALYGLETGAKIILEPTQGKTEEHFDRHFSPDGNYILTVNDERDVLRLWTPDGKPVRDLEGRAGPGLYTGFSPDGSRIVRVNGDKTVRLWGTDGKLVMKAAGTAGTFPLPASFSPDGKQFVLGMESGEIRVYGMDGRPVSSFKSHRSAMAVFSPVGGLIISAGAEPDGEGTLRLYTAAGEPRAVLRRGISGHDLTGQWKYGYSMYLHRGPDADRFALIHFKTISLLDRSGTVLKTADLSPKMPHGYGIQDVRWTAKGIHLTNVSPYEHTIQYLEYGWDLALKKSLRFRGHTSYITEAGTAVNPERRLLLSCSRDGTIKYWSLDSGKCIATLVGFKENAGIIYTPDHYYMLSGDAVNAVAFVKGTKAYGFEQFDLRFNRPDIVLERIYPGQNRPKSIQDDIDRYRRYWRHRVRQNGFSEQELSGAMELHAPEVVGIRVNGRGLDAAEKTLTDRTVELAFTVRDEKGSDRSIIGYRIFVNGVPVHGQYMKRFDAPRKVQRCTEKIILSSVPDAGGNPGVNRIEISGFSEDGVESNRELFYLHYTGTGRDERPDLYIVSLGVNDYRSSRGFESLAYAVKDARDIAGTFRTAAEKSYRNVVELVCTDAGVSREKLLEIRERLGRTTVDDTVIFFLAGHGVRAETPAEQAKQLAGLFGVPRGIGEAERPDGPATVYYYMPGDADAGRPWLRGIPMEAIRHVLDGIPARQKILLVDTCQSGENTLLSGYAPSDERLQEVRRKRGIRDGRSAALRGLRLVAAGKTDERGLTVMKARALDMREMSDMFPELRRGTGTIEISATTGIQAALESKDWTNGAFTYCVKAALLRGGARTPGGMITAKSLRRYVLAEVELLTEGDQTPMVCRDIPGRDFTLTGKQAP